MPAQRMHPDEVDTDVDLVRRLLAAQHPRWAELHVEPVVSSGTDNAMYRLGDDMAVRLPRVPRATGQTEKERRWLPVLAPQLPLPIPVPVARGVPGEGYPFPWSVCRWIDGENPDMRRIADPCQLATDLAQFVTALQRIDATGAPPPNPADRGMPLATRVEVTRDAIAALHGTIDTDRVIAAWEADLWVCSPDLAPLGRVVLI